MHPIKGTCLATTALFARTTSNSAFDSRLTALLLGTLILLPGARPQSLPGETARQAGKLALHQPIERELASGQADVYTVDVAAGLFLHVIVEHNGLFAVLRVEDPQGATLVTADSPNGAFGLEPASLVADRTGPYRVRVTNSPRTAETGRYRIEMTDLRPPTEQDLARMQAEKEFFTAVQEELAPNK